ncbi:uncharacterized protein PHALS_06282 [Plasmopara halstedii]|uniref:Uncharacterized protein n=1 Tax=Plasmopara halstedii TaxID=4781 RepID=A0A0P1B2U3_PLAHL|nr:uncharacterized protein PHALS_06282 [Plasmopara halstedii]CEG48462.1 hypothetical protein PHALS_06282 [Plasmopara halstedii]|eukprot:XP_024584831.1 hypothetical protein PHALS_06282 [Plasmopara halstedii]
MPATNSPTVGIRNREGSRDGPRSTAHRSKPGKELGEVEKNNKRQLQNLQKKPRMQDTQAVDIARVSLDQAAERRSRGRASTIKILRSTSKHSEKSTKHFFRPLNTSLGKVSIEEVITPSGSASSKPQEISLRFLEHWGSEMGDRASPTGGAPPPDEAKQRKLLGSIVKVASDLDRDILNAPVTPSDLASAIKHMNATSAPGMDGLTAGFYQVAPKVFGE